MPRLVPMPRLAPMPRLVIATLISFVSAGSVAAVCAPAAVAAEKSPLVVNANFAGGSCEVAAIDQQTRTVRFKPATRAGRGWVCWWYFQLKGATQGEVITLDCGPSPWATPLQASISTDNKTWRHTQPGKKDGGRIVYKIKAPAKQFWLAWGPPFTHVMASQLVQKAAASPYATAFELCKTREGRSVPALRIHQPAPPADAPQQPLFGLWVQARQHAWEAGASWVCHGFVQWVLSDDPRAASLRKAAIIHVTPVMDTDSVAVGAGGKNQKPQDHNRDWSEKPHWPAVAAAMQKIKQANAASQFDLFIDLHNPAAGDKQPYFYITPRNLLSETGRRNLNRFLAAARQDITGPLKFAGKVQESGPGYDPAWRNISKNWVSFNTSEHVTAVTLETPWNTPASTIDGYSTTGRQLGQAVQRFFQTNPRAGIAE